ncbi:MAG: aminotransferase class I/II-fold pyridoxal phosphate-dependent enzyme [Thermomicrobiales bacterium]
MRPETLAVHAGFRPDPATGAVAAPIYLSSTFERAADGSFPSGYVYTRSGNPNRSDLETALAALEGGAAAAAFASGSAATAAILQALGPSDHVIAPVDTYHGTRKLLREVFGAWGLTASFVDMSDTSAVCAAVRPNTKLIWAETPSNPSLLITDLATMAEIARGAGARLVCDNTWATPVCQRPFAHGADLVMHSTTKYIGGHSDLLGGAVVSKENDDFFARIRMIQGAGGAVPSPFDCWLALRGVRSLPWRMRGHAENAAAVAAFLHEHPAVEATHFPGLPSHPGHAVAARQMTAFGGMVSFQVRGDAARAMAVASRVKLFTRATSLGGVESLIEHRASIEGPDTPTPPNLLRLSIGLEHHDDLIEDLDYALG